MERFIKGDIVVLNFPFSDLSGYKKRPALIISVLRGDDLILSQITSKQTRNDEYAINLKTSDFQKGSLPVEDSIIRTNVLFTGDRDLILKKSGRITDKKLEEVKNKIIETISN
jgi:mRNA interferase MazF